MESRKASKNVTKIQTALIGLLVLLLVAFAAILVAFSLVNFHTRNHSSHRPGSNPSLRALDRRLCGQTLYSSLCFSTLSMIPASSRNSQHLYVFKIVEFSINRTRHRVETARMGLVVHFSAQELDAQERNALRDCMELFDQTLYELQEAVKELTSRLYGSVKTLLSAAMTNQNTCINGFLDLEQLHSGQRPKGHVDRLQSMLTPISQMISNCLALIKHVEKTKGNQQGTLKKAGKLARNFRRRKGHSGTYVTVASDGSGDYTTIGKAIAMAPRMSSRTHRIKIKAGVYREHVIIPREKINLMLIGEGMNSTIITGSRNFVDGFSTFESATLTVVGDKFLARDLTIQNTASPEKHQAVALRVTSNAAFYRCGIISHQDTLYAHSLRQLYRECSIQGTIDFIFGNAAAVFQNCKILVRQPIPGQRNMITAQGRDDPNQNTGIILQSCTIAATKEFSPDERRRFSTYLGRPWRNYSRTIVINSYLGDVIHPQGWFAWNEHSNLDTVQYIEYRNSGPGADTRSRVSWAGYRRNCSENIVRQFRPEEFLHGADYWLESVVFPLFSS